MPHPFGHECRQGLHSGRRARRCQQGNFRLCQFRPALLHSHPWGTIASGITIGAHPGRQSAAEITLFDATGDLQDLAVAAMAMRAVERGPGTEIVV